MPRDIRMHIDEKTLRDQIREHPNSTRWVSNRGVERKKQGSGKGKRNAVDENYAPDMYARERHVQEIDRDLYERDAHAQEMQAQEMHERQMRARQTNAGEIQEMESQDVETRGHHGFNRGPDEDPSRDFDHSRLFDPSHIYEPARLSGPYDDIDDYEDEYDPDYQQRHGARSSRRSVHFDDDEEDPEMGFARPRRSYRPIPSNSQYLDQRANNTRRPAPDFHPEIPRQRNPPSGMCQMPHVQPHRGAEAPQWEQPWRNG